MARVRLSISIDEDLDVAVSYDAMKRRTSKAQIVREILADHYQEELAELAEERVESE